MKLEHWASSVTDEGRWLPQGGRLARTARLFSASLTKPVDAGQADGGKKVLELCLVCFYLSSRQVSFSSLFLSKSDSCRHLPHQSFPYDVKSPWFHRGTSSHGKS